ncbi:MAG TPA: GNAT family N-acetyltransferase [Streptosporangiaceae bacterium]|jgi:RimJ/RimL family protein N-acetyltransferase
MPDNATPALRIVPFTEADLDLLRRLNTEDMKHHLGGLETDEQLRTRHRRYLNFAPGQGCMFRIVLPGSGGEAAGTVGYGERTWQGSSVYEMGWQVLPAHQGRGIATAAARAGAAHAAGQRRHRYLHAFPSIENVASNAICRKVGFRWASECDFEYPAGRFMRSNDWVLDLTTLE